MSGVARVEQLECILLDRHMGLAFMECSGCRGSTSVPTMSHHQLPARSISQRESASRLHTHTRWASARDRLLRSRERNPPIHVEAHDALTVWRSRQSAAMLRRESTVTYSQHSVLTHHWSYYYERLEASREDRRSPGIGGSLSQLLMGKKCLGSEQYRNGNVETLPSNAMMPR